MSVTKDLINNIEFTESNTFIPKELIELLAKNYECEFLGIFLTMIYLTKNDFSKLDSCIDELLARGTTIENINLVKEFLKENEII